MANRPAGIKSAELIEDKMQLNKIYRSLIVDATKWMLVTKLDWEQNGFVNKGEFIMVPSTKSGVKQTGDIVASVGDYVITFKDGRKTVVFTPEIKERIARGDFTWMK